MSTATARLTKREIERAYFERFNDVYPLPPGDIAYGDQPDIILTGARRIGIEITRFFLKSGSDPGSEQQQKPVRAWVAAEAYKLYLASGGKGTKLTLAFNAGHPITLERKRVLASELAELAKRNDRGASGPLPTVIPELSRLYLNAGDHPDAKWWVQGIYDVRPMSTEGLEDIIREKEEKASKYATCDAYWLLVVVDCMDTAQDQEIQLDDLSVHSKVFERIIIYKTGFEHVVEVQT